MHVDRLRIERIRCFEKLDLHLARQRREAAGWTVLAGRNGTGKTTLLQAIAATVLGPSNTTWMLEKPEEWIRLKAEEGRVDLWLGGLPRDDWRDDKDIQGNFRLGVTWSRRGGTKTHPPRGNHSFVMNQLWEGATFGAEPRGWCLAGYGANRFMAPPSSTAEQLMGAPPRRSAVVSLFKRDASLRAANGWVKDVVSEYLSHRVARRFTEGVPAVEATDWEDTDPRAALVRNRYWALQMLLSDGLLRDESPRGAEGTVGAVRLDTSGLVASRPEGTVPVGTLGQGYESLALLVTDLIRQMAGFYGDRFLGGAQWRPPADGRVVVQHSGVVLIDEMENHLHPQLQQMVGFWLKEHFPRVQFIVTTHSPFICQAADEGGLFRLSGGGLVEPVSEDVFRSVVNGSVEDAVLTELFGLPYPYSDASRRLRDELARIESRLLAGEALTEDQERRRNEILEDLPDDPNTEVDRMISAMRSRR